MDDGDSLERILAAAIRDRDREPELCPGCRQPLRVVVVAENPGDATSPVIVRGVCPACPKGLGAAAP
ncbi:hypothetical protein [Streptomyces sp. XH2]|uniref:hypothetical protein n=1 Tax=Streptomyces sp. XH2 TaxID=3412483 RepID=UPI003C7DE029